MSQPIATPLLIDVGLLVHYENPIDGLRQAVDAFVAGRGATGEELGQAWTKFKIEREAMHLSIKTLKALKSNVGRFVAGQEKTALSAIKRDDVMTWLQNPEWGPRTFNSYLTSLDTFFKWCVATERLGKSPTAAIPKIKAKQMPDIDEPPTILHLDQVKALLRATGETDKGLIPYVALGLFAGLRPQREDGQITWGDIDGTVFVRGLHAKNRQQRHVRIHPTLRAWLDLKGDLPPKDLRRRFERVRIAAGLIAVKVRTRKKKKGKGVTKIGQKITWTGWDQDCLRHTFASRALPVFGAEKTVEQLGSGDYETLFKHYGSLVTREDAQEFWNLTPEKVLGSQWLSRHLHPAFNRGLLPECTLGSTLE
jgi:integrase